MDSKGSYTAMSEPVSGEPSTIASLINRHNVLLRYLWRLLVFVVALTSVYLFIISFYKEDAYRRFYSRDYRNCRLETRLVLSGDGTLLYLSYVNDSLLRRTILASDDDGKTFEEQAQLPYADSLVILSVTPDGEKLIAAEVSGAIYITDRKESVGQVNVLKAQEAYFSEICYSSSPGAKKAYLYGARNTVLWELDYKAGQIREISYSPAYIIISLDFSGQGVGALVSDRGTGFSSRMEAGSLPELLLQLDKNKETAKDIEAVRSKKATEYKKAPKNKDAAKDNAAAKEKEGAKYKEEAINKRVFK